MQSNKSIYEQLGGEGAIETAVNIFYEKMLADETVCEFFSETNMTTQKKHQKNFLSFALGGPNKYEGRDMRKAHLKFKLTDDHFNTVVKHLGSTLKELGVSDELIGQAAAVVETTRNEVLNR